MTQTIKHIQVHASSVKRAHYSVLKAVNVLILAHQLQGKQHTTFPCVSLTIFVTKTPLWWSRTPHPTQGRGSGKTLLIALCQLARDTATRHRSNGRFKRYQLRMQ